MMAHDRQNLEKLKARIEQAVIDGLVTPQELQEIRLQINADGQVSMEELALCADLIWDKLDRGELTFKWP
jgi:hypothetical protein